MTNQDLLVDCIRHAVMAPSSHNTQPWIFTVRSGEIRIRPDFARALPVVDPDHHALFVSLGCALENLVVAAEHNGLDVTVSPFSDDAQGGCVRITLRRSDADRDGPKAQANARLFKAIPERQSTRRTFDGRPLPEATCAALQAIAEDCLVTTRMIVDREEVEAVADHVQAACRSQWEDPAFVTELIEWIRFSRREADLRRDGLAAPVMGLPNVPRWLGQMVMRFAVKPGREATRTAAQVCSSSGVMIFSVTEDRPEAWVRAGRSFQRVALRATDAGLKHAHSNMPCEVESAREGFRSAFALKGRPVLLIRLGFAAAMPSSRRRALGEVVRFEHQ